MFEAFSAAVSGGALGGLAIHLSGMTAAGLVGGGAGIGSAAGPVGTVAGAVVGLAVYGVVRAVGG